MQGRRSTAAHGGEAGCGCEGAEPSRRHGAEAGQPTAQTSKEAEEVLLRVCKTLRDRLLNEPESGMGYQITTIAENAQYVIMNAELALPLPVESKGGVIPPIKLAIEDLEYLTAEARQESSHEVIQPELDSLEELLANDDTVLYVQQHGSYLSQSLPSENFVRYSAFRNDLRINSDGSVQPGTYVTTATDAGVVPSGLAAVARYALPNKTPAVFRFTVSPPDGTAIRCGTVTPNFGEAGGGVEVFLTNGAPANSALGPNVISER